ncbi:hypothetical protein D3C80_387890 [compost metagenome]
MSKPLYVLISDGGDGSHYPRYTFNTDLINKLQRAEESGAMDYENGIGVDGDGFHYSIINVPDECTAESLGIRVIPDNFADRFCTEEDEE